MRSFHIGKVLGIDIRVDSSWLFIFVLMTWNLTAVFGHWHPSWSAAEQFAVAIVASLLFFGCILAHELAHSAVAMRFGVRVRSITLFLFGGVSNIEHEPAAAAAEFSTAIVGPLTSIALGVIFVLLGGAVTAGSLQGAPSLDAVAANLGPLETLLVWLGPINVVIGVFNLIPAFPLDGGRVLRSILWAISHNLKSATGQASAIGQAIGWLFVVAGIAMAFGLRLPFFGTGIVGGLWLAFIGWFVQNGALQAYRRLAIDEALAGHTVEEMMRVGAPVLPPDLPVSVFVHDYLVRSDERALPVVRDGQLLGVVSLPDIRAVPSDEWPSTPIGAVMRPRERLAVATPREPLTEAFTQLASLDLDELPVLEGGRLVGVLQRRDIARWLQLN